MSISKEELKQELSNLEHRLGEKFATKQELADVKSELKADIADVKTELKADIADVKVELVASMIGIAEDLKRHFDFTVERIRSDKEGC